MFQEEKNPVKAMKVGGTFMILFPKPLKRRIVNLLELTLQPSHEWTP